MKKLLLSAIALLAVSTVSAEEQKVILTTNREVGQEITLLVNTVHTGVTVDWGDGVAQTYTNATGGIHEISGNVKGSEIIISAPKGWVMLAAADAGITKADISKATELRSLYLQDNALTELSVSDMAQLRDLNVANNQLTALVLNTKNNPNIETLDISNNPIAATTFTYGSDNLRYLNLSGLNYSSVTMTRNTNLDALLVAGNQLKSLTLSAPKKLSLLDARGNNLERLIVSTSGLPEMQQMLVDDNSLETIDLGLSTRLNTLTLARNAVKSVVLPAKTTLQVYDCSENALTFSSLPRKTYEPSVYFGYANQAAFDVSGLNLNEPTWTSKYLPWLTMNPSYSSRGDEQYQLDLSGQLAGSGSTTVQFEVISVTPEGETVLEKASATQKELDYSLVGGKITVLKPFPELYVRMTDNGYPDLVVNTTHFAVLDPQSEGIDEIVTDSGADSGAPAYDLQGRRLQNTPSKGIFIVGSRKIVK